MTVSLKEIFKTGIGEVNICTDSREIKSGDFFLPIKGENFDGHDYIEQALEKGAIGAFCNEDSLDKVQTKDKVISVKDTLETYHQIANHYRKKINPKVIGITGSSGKTTTKEMMRCVLSKKFRTHFSKANFNNEIGVPKTILEMPEDTEVLILEMGMRGLGQISLLSKTAEPDYAVITNVGSAHIEKLGTLSNIRQAKLEITDHLSENGILFIDEDLHEELLAIGSIEEDRLKGKHYLKYFHYEPFFNIKGLAGREIHADANAVKLVAKEFGFSDDEIQDGLDDYEPGPGRGKFIYDDKGNIFIDDTYNANPESVKASVNAMISQFPEKKKIAVIGKIAENSPDLIKKLFKDLNEKSNGECIIIDAQEMKVEDIKNLLDKEIEKETVILIKASREAKLEKLLKHYEQ